MVTTAIKEALQRHDNLRDILERYPAQAPSLSQTLIDLTHASKWQHLRVIDIAPPGKEKDNARIDDLGRALVVGLRPEAKGLEAVWSCEISDMLNSAIFQDIFAALDELKLSVAVEGGKEMNLLRTHFLIAVHSPDATVVYYNMARGLVKPVN